MPSPWGTLISNTMMVMMMAITPSLNASSRFFPMQHVLALKGTSTLQRVPPRMATRRSTGKPVALLDTNTPLRHTHPHVRCGYDKPDDDKRDGRCDHRRSVRAGQELCHSKPGCPQHTAHSNEDRGAHCYLPSFPPGQRDGRRNITTELSRREVK